MTTVGCTDEGNGEVGAVDLSDGTLTVQDIE